jgi:hypothetical protein
VNKTGEKHVDLLTGNPSVRRLLEDDAVVFFDKIKDLTTVENWEEQTKDILKK